MSHRTFTTSQDHTIVISILIVNYNGESFITNCLQNVIKYKSSEIEIIVLDNNSSDQSLNIIESFHSLLTIIPSAVNLGFAEGMNLAASRAKGRWLLLLNPDTVLLFDPILMVKKAELDPSIGVMGPKILYPNGLQQCSFGYEHTPIRILTHWMGGDQVDWLSSVLSLRENRASFYLRINNVVWLSGACLLTPRATWAALGGLDARFFMYVEDVDYCKRVSRIGLKILYDPAFQIVHSEGKCSTSTSSALRHTFISYLAYSRKWYGSQSTNILRILLLITMMTRFISILLLGVLSINYHLILQSKKYFRITIDGIKGKY